jgi:phosphoglycerate kinase
MQLKSIRQADVKGKSVLVRVDFNVELNLDGDVTEGYKLEIANATIDYLINHGAKAIGLLTHLGRPCSKDDQQFSVLQIKDDVERALQRTVTFISDCIGAEVGLAIQKTEQGGVVLLENSRFYPGDEDNDAEFARQLAEPFDIFVNEAFSASHRAHASVVGVTQILPAYAGFHVLDEVEHLEQVKASPEHPAVAVIGGAKIETKLPLIRAFEKHYDFILVGGKIANEALDEGLEFAPSVVLPEDFDSDQRFDIGPATAARFAEIISQAKTIVWNGPMGKFEEEAYARGTDVVMRAILENKEALSVVGGGESLVALENAHAMHKVSFVSTGGGAMLKFLASEPMPGLEVLQ